MLGDTSVRPVLVLSVNNHRFVRHVSFNICNKFFRFKILIFNKLFLSWTRILSRKVPDSFVYTATLEPFSLLQRLCMLTRGSTVSIPARISAVIARIYLQFLVS
ncbi:hypothetical protein AQUCO_00800072v1 [Aquilegia coerulea]|uniref:Uncharacterized protein n=1 Tax=Aquilegia coerulea TaxID=218851 RepID=A0A2G5EH29_AQUCA|nr:hypothetical protein AQUCO_00800072v1 [Aquilegia coerulea]